MSYSMIYEEKEKEMSFSDFTNNPYEMEMNKGMFDNFWEVSKISAEESFKTSSIIAEQINERKYWKDNDIKAKNAMSEKDYYGAYQHQKTIDINRYNEITQKLKNGDFDFSKNGYDEDYIKDVKAIQFYNDFVEKNPQLKLSTKEKIRENVVRDIQNLRQERQIRTSQQGSIVGEFVGDFGGLMADPINAATLFIPVVGQARNASLLARSLNIGAKTALMEGGIETFNQFAAVMPYRRDYLGDNYTTVDAIGSVASVAFGSFLLGGGLNAAGELGSAFLRKRQGNYTQKLVEKNEQKRAENPDEITASEIEAGEGLKVMNNKLSKAPDEFQNENLVAFDKALHDISTGKNVKVDPIVDDMRKNVFTKFIDDVNQKPDEYRKLIGNEFVDYLKEVGDIIKDDLSVKSLREVFEDSKDIFNKRFEVIESPKQKAKQEQDLTNNKINQIYKRESNLTNEQMEEFDLTLNSIDNTIEEMSKIKEAEPFIKDMVELKDNIIKTKQEQENLLDFQACLIGGKNE